METIKIILLDDHQMFRDGVRSVISDEDYIEVSAAVGSAKELYEALENETADVLITDITMPDISGIEVTEYIRRKYPEIKVLILSMHSNEEFIIKALNAGASGYLPKETSIDELLEAVNALYKGKNYFNKDISDTIMYSVMNRRSEKPDERAKINELTKREKEILKLVVEGLTNKEIADSLNISIRTVDSHKNNMMNKLELKSTVELVKFAIKYKLAVLN
jgi:DNA-binding NarL/FixJ family response regulator